ncbi:FecR family protein [Eilatimonas milleporae]|uniref:FecR family protein n=1 Tax=Eilatimonas milleporae TaxID=911205 RepID=A0A3M0CM99_9PROT|nr:FecR domain-containing protein [Eilatimonas milleporae]RMB08066.1 FecR family protein [Eilatimonas milleporae]
MTDNGTRPEKPTRDAAIDAEAQAWLAHLYSGEDGGTTHAAFRTWLNADSRHRAAFQQAHDLWQSLTAVPAVEDVLDAGMEDPGSTTLEGGAGHGLPERLPEGLPEGLSEDPAEGLSAPRAKRRPRRSLATAIAAVAAVIAVFVIGAVFIPDPFQGPAARALHATAVGEIRTVALPDGSRATLGADSALEIVFSGRERAVTLTRGRAFFDVAPDPRRLFRVTAGRTRVSVIGTEFEVAKRPGTVSVAVREGRVAVAPRAAGPGTGAVPALELAAGQKVVASLSGTLGKTAPFDAAAGLAWRDGHLSYTNARLGDVIADFNRHRDDRISLGDPRLGDPRLGDRVVTVAGSAAQIDQMLAGIAASEGLRLEKTPSGWVLSATAD